jgi:hypothetical protein
LLWNKSFHQPTPSLQHCTSFSSSPSPTSPNCSSGRKHNHLLIRKSNIRQPIYWKGYPILQSMRTLTPLKLSSNRSHWSIALWELSWISKSFTCSSKCLSSLSSALHVASSIGSLCGPSHSPLCFRVSSSLHCKYLCYRLCSRSAKKFNNKTKTQKNWSKTLKYNCLSQSLD